MTYQGTSVFPQQELESVRRARKAAEAQEYGVKGMKWGSGHRSGARAGIPKGYVKAGKDYWTGEDHWVPKGAIRRVPSDVKRRKPV